jgi:hypothetical protein
MSQCFSINSEYFTFCREKYNLPLAAAKELSGFTM